MGAGVSKTLFCSCAFCSSHDITPKYYIYNDFETNQFNLNFSDKPSNVGKQQFWANDPENREQWVRSIRRVVWAPFGGGIFGQDLCDTMNYEKRTSKNEEIPKIVENCCEFLKNHGIK